MTRSVFLLFSAAPLLAADSSVPLAPPSPAPSGATLLEEQIVTGKAEDLLGSAPSATKGQASAEELMDRPLLRRGELLEAVPGVIITQHSGGGKANQYFLRGFNLDHGTDFGVFLDGMQVNFRTHAHGQGYADLNFIIPELIGRLDYRKGPYFAALGDLTTAGEANYRLVDRLDQGIATFSFGEDDYFRAFLGDSFQAGDGDLTLGVETTHENGPWDTGDDFVRWNGVVKYHTGTETEFTSLTGMYYQGRWDATDQVAKRAIDQGIIGRFGRLSQSEGGETRRASLQFIRQWQEDKATTRISAYAGYYDLDLFSNFTYFLDNPERGDQFEQADRRGFAGLSAVRTWDYLIQERSARTMVGFDTRQDLLDGVGLFKTESRRRFDTVRQDDVYEASASLFAEHGMHLADWMRFTAGLRGDLFLSLIHI